MIYKCEDLEEIQKKLDKMDSKGWANFTEKEVLEYLELMKKKQWASRYNEEWMRRVEIAEHHIEEALLNII